MKWGLAWVLLFRSALIPDQRTCFSPNAASIMSYMRLSGCKISLLLSLHPVLNLDRDVSCREMLSGIKLHWPSNQACQLNGTLSKLFATILGSMMKLLGWGRLCFILPKLPKYVVITDQSLWYKRCLLSRSLTVDFIFIFLFSLYFIFIFSIFRTTRVRVYQSHCHKLMAKSLVWSRVVGEWSRRFWNKVTS